MKLVFFLFIIVIHLFFVTESLASNRVIDLHIAYKTVNFCGECVKAIAVNNQIPAPTLHFKEGDHITLNVYNHLDKDTAIHWHGILVPWQMDGVEGVSQRGIPPGKIFHYQFTLHQSGTYWYHAHAGLQEQQGLYGAFIIDPLHHSHYKYSKDYVIVLSDWSNTDPDQILANLKKKGDYYSPRFPLQPSLEKFLHDYRKSSIVERQNLIDDYKMMQQMRMSIYDISDVAYDAFLLNGHPPTHPWTAFVKVGDMVRLRFIGAAGSTIFHVKIPGAIMQLVHVQGNDVRPYTIKDFTIAPGETVDVLIRIKKNDPYIIYAESNDTVATALGALVTSTHHFVNYKSVKSFPEPKPITREMMSLQMEQSMSMGHVHNMNMSMDHSHSMNMPTESKILGDRISTPYSLDRTSTQTKYQNLTAVNKTNNSRKPVNAEIKMELFGYMDHFIWFINGLPEYKTKPIILQPNKRYRIIFTNSSMMHHPMHIHGHWFILRKGNGDYDPLLHTIDVPPGATVIADVDTDASGQWFFHCHLLYHMIAGMSRVLQYSTLIELTHYQIKPQNIVKNTSFANRPIIKVDEVRPIDKQLIESPMAHPAEFWFSNFLDIGEDPFHNIQELTFKGLYGSDYNKLELLTEEAELNKGVLQNADVDIFYWHLISQFWAIKGGMNYFYRPAKIPYWQPGVGIEGLMPYFIDVNARLYYHSGSTKLDIDLSRDSQMTNNFFIRLGIRSILASKTVLPASLGSGVNQMRYTIRPYYRLMPGLSLFAEYEYDQNYGPFRQLQKQAGESASENMLTLGISWLF